MTAQHDKPTIWWRIFEIVGYTIIVAIAIFACATAYMVMIFVTENKENIVVMDKDGQVFVGFKMEIK